MSQFMNSNRDFSINNTKVITYTLTDIPYNRNEIFRYAHSENISQISELIDSCISEIDTKLVYKVCYRECHVSVQDNTLELGFVKTTSKDLYKNLKSCHKCVVFASTIGIEIDRLINKYGSTQPSKALILQAIGSERIESLCNRFNADINRIYLAQNITTCPRFSPGYGDLSIDIQKDIFTYLNCSKHIGVMLNNSLSISPSKSVTAFIGICNERN